MAIGAGRAQALGLVLGSGLRLWLLGATLGVAGAQALTRLLRGLLFGVTTHNPFAFAAYLAVLVAVTLLACLLPTLRAAGVDPMSTLRVE
jgi:ABC-type antimicrobial peptide transport system permease subunit